MWLCRPFGVCNSCVTGLLLHPERAGFAGTGVAVGLRAETLQCLPTARAGCFCLLWTQGDYLLKCNGRNIPPSPPGQALPHFFPHPKMHKKEHVYLSHCPEHQQRMAGVSRAWGSLWWCKTHPTPWGHVQHWALHLCSSQRWLQKDRQMQGMAVVRLVLIPMWAVSMAWQWWVSDWQSRRLRSMTSPAALILSLLPMPSKWGGLLQQRYWVTSTLVADPVSHTRHLACPMGQLCKSPYRCCSKWPKPGIWICNLWVLPRHSLQPCVCPSPF